MSKAPKISVIVPVYKAEKYLHKCVDSLLAQTFTDFEILLIDDGSPDKSGEICDEYALKDNRIRVFHKENGGVSSARQCGLDNARGEYVIHADPDDWVEANMLEELYAKAKEEDADMVICDYYNDSNNKSIYVKQSPSLCSHNMVLMELFQHLHGACWNKLVRRICFNVYNIKFPKNFNFCEDLFVSVSLLVYRIKVTYLAKSYYHYVRDYNEDSVVKLYSKDKVQEDNSMKESILRLINQAFPNNLTLYSIAEDFLNSLLISRAFAGQIYTAKEFKDNFININNCLFPNCQFSVLMKILYYISTIGGYSFAIYIYISFKNVQKWIKS